MKIVPLNAVILCANWVSASCSLLKELKALRFNPNPISFYQRELGQAWYLSDDRSTVPGLPFLKVGFPDSDRKKLKVFPTSSANYMYFKLHGNLNTPAIFSVPSFSPWAAWSCTQKLGNQTNEIFLTLWISNGFQKVGPPQRENKLHRAKLLSTELSLYLSHLAIFFFLFPPYSANP